MKGKKKKKLKIKRNDNLKSILKRCAGFCARKVVGYGSIKCSDFI